MLFKPVAFLALAGSALAVWDIEDNVSFSYKDDKQKESMTKAFASQESAYLATLTTGADWSKAWAVLSAYQITGKDVPAAVTAADTTTTYSATPAWYSAMPTQAKNVFDGMEKKKKEIASSIQESANKQNGATRLGTGLYLSGAVAAMVAGAAVML